MALFKLLRGQESDLVNQPLHDGYIWVTKDLKNMWFDYVDETNTLVRKRINAEFADKLRYVKDGETIELDPSEIVTKFELASADFATNTSVARVKEELQANIDGKASASHKHEEYLMEQKQADWNQTDVSAVDYIKNKPEIVSDDEFLAWLNDAKIVEPVSSTSGEIYINNDDKIYVL